MIARWYIGFLGDHPDRPKAWHDIFTCPDFRHCMVLGYDPYLRIWVMYDPLTTGTRIEVFDIDDKSLNIIIAFITEHGRWLKTDPGSAVFPAGQWRLYCVPAIKHLLGIKSSALTPKGLYRDLLKAGAQPVFERKEDGQNIKRGKPSPSARTNRRRNQASENPRTRTGAGRSRTH